MTDIDHILLVIVNVCLSIYIKRRAVTNAKRIENGRRHILGKRHAKNNLQSARYFNDFLTSR